MYNSFANGSINLELSLEEFIGYKALKINNTLYSKRILLGQYKIWTIVDDYDQYLDITNSDLFTSTFNIIHEIKSKDMVREYIADIYNLLFIDVLYIIKIYMTDLYNAFYLSSCAEEKVSVIINFIKYILDSNFGIEYDYSEKIDIPNTDFSVGKPMTSVILAEHRSIISHQIGSNMSYRKEVVALDSDNVFNFYHNTLFLEVQDFKTRSVQYWYCTSLLGIKDIFIGTDSAKKYIKDITVKISSLYLVYNLDIDYIHIEKFITDKTLNTLLRENMK